MLRGIALLGILFINIPYMAAPVAQFSADVRAIGWTLPDRIAWSVNYLVWSGTMRCVLQFLFGAGMMILTARAMEPDGPVAVADQIRRASCRERSVRVDLGGRGRIKKKTINTHTKSY